MEAYRTVDALVEAITQRRWADRTTEIESLSRISDSGPNASARSNGRLWVHRDPSGRLSGRLLYQSQASTPRAVMTELLVVGDDAWVRLDQQVRRDAQRPWLRVRPEGDDANSAHFAPRAAWMRRDHPIDLLLLGPATVLDAEVDAVDGVAALRYLLSVEVDGSRGDPTAEQFRARGLSSVQAVVHVDADDRMLRYRAAFDFPTGGRFLDRHRTLAQGEPITIAPPPETQVAEPGR